MLRHVLDREMVETVAARARQAAQTRGWIGTDGRATASMHGKRLDPVDPALVAFQAEVLGSLEVANLRADRSLHRAVATHSGRFLTPAGADICRITFPDEPEGTPAHQDAWYCKVPGLCIAWIPLVACSRRLGALEVADRERPLAEHDAEGLIDDAASRWRSVPCGPGDVLLFSGLTPHRSLPNRSAGRVRLSLDIRFGEDTGEYGA
ncbi:phytanoyl-CoA dioxygenase family protein [Roseibium sp. M-1]